jgi:hypothetical protein
MSYAPALEKAWLSLSEVSGHDMYPVRFLADTYTVSPAQRTVVSDACNVPAKDLSAILIVHYLARKLKGLPPVSGEWLTFRELVRIEGYYPAFKQRVVSPLVRKYGKRPWALKETAERFGAASAAQAAEDADAAVIVHPCDGVPMLIKLWAADDEFGPDAAVFFDCSITGIFCTEDIIVLAQLVSAGL